MDVVSLTFKGVPLLSSLQVDDFVTAALGAAFAAALLVSAGFCANAKVTNNAAHIPAVIDEMLGRNIKTPEVENGKNVDRAQDAAAS
jgi:hypothetical protein